MAENINIVSFDLDTKEAIRATDAYIATLNKLEAELVQLKKEGKSTAATQQKIAQTTDLLTRSLQQETTTTKGTVAQTMALNSSLTKATAATQKAVIQTDNLAKANNRGAASFARSIGGAKSFASALARGGGALSNLVGGFGLSSMAISSLSNVLTSAVQGLMDFFDVSKSVKETQESIAEATRSVAAEYVNEARDLNGLLGPLSDVNTSSADRAALIDEIKKKYPEYLQGLTDEDFKLGNIAATQKIVNDRLIDGIVIKAKEAEQGKIIAKIVENQIKLDKLRAGGVGDLIKQEANAANAAAAAANALLNPFADANLADISLFANLTKEQKDLTTELNNLPETFKGVNTSLKGLNLDLGKNTALSTEAIAAADAKAKADAKAAAVKSKEAKTQSESNTLLVGSLAFLEAQLSKVNKALNEQTEITDSDALSKLGAEYKRLTIEIDLAKKAIEDVTKVRQAETAVLIKNANIGDIRAEAAKFQALAELTALKQSVEQIELQKQLDLNRLEQTRQAQLKVVQNDQAQAVINAANASQRADVEKAADTEILNARLAVQQQLRAIALSSGETVTAIDTEIASLRASLLALTGKDYDIKIKVDGKKTTEELSGVVEKVAAGVEQFSAIAFNFLNQQSQAQIQKAEEAIAKQKGILDAVLANESTANAEQVRLEQERLDALNKEREKAKNKEAIIAQAQIAINLAVAVARAAAEGGGVASAITIAAAIAAAVVGFISAKQAASQAFYGGTLYAERAPNEQRGRDTIHARINEGEAIIPTATNAAYSGAVAAIYNKSVPANALNEFVANYGKIDKSAKELRNTARYSSGEYSLVAMTRADRLPKTNAGNSNNADSGNIKMMLDIFINELRKQDTGNKKKSSSDTRGKIRARFGVSK